MADSIRARLSLWYAGGLALALALVAAAQYLMVAQAMHRRLDDSLRSSAQAMAGLLEAERDEGEPPAQAAQSTIDESALTDKAVALLDDAGRVLATREAPGKVRVPPLDRLPAPGPPALATETEAGGRLRVAALSASLANGERYTIVLAQSLKPLDDELSLIRRAVALAGLVAAALAALGGWILAGRSLAPVVAMCDQARRIGGGDLEKRLPVGNPRDELGTLATTFNDLLARLAASLERQRQFMADASHELRTPLSIVRTAATLTLEKQPRAEAEYREAMTLVAAESRRLTRLVDDMLTLARADAGHYPLRLARTCLAELLADVASSGSVLGRPLGIRVSFAFDGEAPIDGDEDLLRRMLLNLVENAVMHSPTGGTVTLGLSPAPGAWAVTVRDQGRGIPPEERARVFDRFHRAEADDAPVSVGAGLGLPIARWIAEAHGGSLELGASDGRGTTFLASLPAARDRSRDASVPPVAAATATV